jgi:hypothetical protein
METETVCAILGVTLILSVTGYNISDNYMENEYKRNLATSGLQECVYSVLGEQGVMSTRSWRKECPPTSTVYTEK